MFFLDIQATAATPAHGQMTRRRYSGPVPQRVVSLKGSPQETMSKSRFTIPVLRTEVLSGSSALPTDSGPKERGSRFLSSLRPSSGTKSVQFGHRLLAASQGHYAGSGSAIKLVGPGMRFAAV